MNNQAEHLSTNEKDSEETTGIRKGVTGIVIRALFSLNRASRYTGVFHIDIKSNENCGGCTGKYLGFYITT